MNGDLPEARVTDEVEMIESEFNKQWAKMGEARAEEAGEEKARILASITRDRAEVCAREVAEANVEPYDFVLPGVLRQLRAAVREKTGITNGAMSLECDPVQG